MSESTQDPRILDLATKIVLAHMSKSDVEFQALPGLIRGVYQTLATVGTATVGTAIAAPAVGPQEPAVPIRKSVFPDYIICLEDGKRMKMLKRHLATAYNMTPDDYRRKWGLGPNYPMVAPNYAEVRSSLAKQMGLGKRTGKPKRRKKRA
jgi:predicted transcriptional regulator